MRSARTAAQRATLHCLQGFCSSPSSACSPLLHFSTLGPTSPASGLLGDCAAQAHLHLSTPSCALLLTAASGVRGLFSSQGFWEIVPRKLISIFNDHELELLISGLPEIDVDDLRAHTDYQGKEIG